MQQPEEQVQPIKTLVDNRPGNTLLEVIRRIMAESRKVDIATGYFEIGSLLDLDGAWQIPGEIRLLMGDEITRRGRKEFIDALRERDKNGIERAQIEDDWQALEGLEAIKAAIISRAIQTKVYTKAKFHAKAYHFYTSGNLNHHGVVGSSNFTSAGLKQNLELNLHSTDQLHLNALAEWFEQAWDEAEELTEDLLNIIEPHIREYLPFEIYVQAMREYFHDRESDQSGWEKNESAMYGVLANYQRDAYHDLIAMAKEHGGAMLCDGVGLGKTFVALMLIEHALKIEKHKVLVIAPKSAIPSVWKRNLNKYFPDHFGSRFSTSIEVLPMTDFGREDGITDKDMQTLRQLYDTIIIDEAHHFRVANRNRSERLKELVEGKRTFLLTATPVNNSLFDLYSLIVNYIANGKQNHFQGLGIPNLRMWFNKVNAEKIDDQVVMDFAKLPEYEQFLRHVIVSRSRKYVKTLETQDDAKVVFPTRDWPVVIEYSLKEVYGDLLPKLLKAFETEKGTLKLVLYETEKFKVNQDTAILNEQSNVVGLVRTMLLKRLESSQVALQASLEDLLIKHLILFAEIHPLKHSAWLAENAEFYRVLQVHKAARSGVELDDEEDNELPITSYESKKLAALSEDTKEFGDNQQTWIDCLQADIETLTEILKGLHGVTHPENDAKLKAFINKIKNDSDLLTKKVVIFSEFKDTARYIENQLKRHFNQNEIEEVDSGRNVNGRERIIQRFAPYYNCETDEELQAALQHPIRLLVTTDVLSEGLNLQDANQIVNYDLHWNPVRLMQRIGRVDRRMDPDKPVKYDSVRVFNFLPPKELDDVLGLYNSISGKLIAINKTLGIEAPVLTAEDDFKAMDFYQNLGDSEISPQEQLRLQAHALENDHPEIWEESTRFPNRIYSGKSNASQLFLAYRVVTGIETPSPSPGSPPPEGKTLPQTGEARRGPQILTDVRWFMIDCATREVTQDITTIHRALQCEEGSKRITALDKQERTRLRKVVEEILAVRLHKSQLPVTMPKDELICWMEV